VTLASFRTLPEAEQRQRIAELQKELVSFRLKARQGAFEQPHRIRQARRALAGMLTVLQEQTRNR
jgi:ribosomal protein L29